MELGQPEKPARVKSMDRVDFQSPAVQCYLSILQNVISRMAGNSAACKTWCVGLVSAIVVILAGKATPDYLWISLIPIGLFLILDSYYLGLEREFRDSYNSFIVKLHSGTAVVEDLFIVSPSVNVGSVVSSTFKALLSFSVWPFYGLLSAMLIVLRAWVL